MTYYCYFVIIIIIHVTIIVTTSAYRKLKSLFFSFVYDTKVKTDPIRLTNNSGTDSTFY